MSLVDNKGLGKPDKFTGTEENSFLKYPTGSLRVFGLRGSRRGATMGGGIGTGHHGQ